MRLHRAPVRTAAASKAGGGEGRRGPARPWREGGPRFCEWVRLLWKPMGRVLEGLKIQLPLTRKPVF